MRPFFFEFRDGSVERIGKGKEQRWAQMTVPSNMHIGEIFLPDSNTFLHTLEGDNAPRLSFMLVHDVAEHAGALRDFGRNLAEQCGHAGSFCNVYAVRSNYHLLPICPSYAYFVCVSD
jgi:hypothetical protein